MRDVIDLHEVLSRMLDAAELSIDVADRMPIDKQVELITSKTLQSSAYSKAARVQLMLLGAAWLCAQPEEVTE